MSRAEDKAEEYCKSTLVGSLYVKKMAFLEGYHQAEKDLELTVNDIMKIGALLIDMWNSQSENKYQEVLKRFNKERKEK